LLRLVSRRLITSYHATIFNVFICALHHFSAAAAAAAADRVMYQIGAVRRMITRIGLLA
jgi:hypothetical protein